MQYICPILIVENMDRAREFYEKILEQTIKFEVGKSITFEGDFVLQEQARFHEQVGEITITQESNSFQLYFEQEDMMDFLQKLEDNGVELIHELKEQPWRQQILRFYDPDRHIIEVGETMQHLCGRLRKEGLSEEEVHEITKLPMEFIEFVFSMNEE